MWNKWFDRPHPVSRKRVTMRWLRSSPSNRTSRCDKAWSHVVQPDEPRLQADTGDGPVRRRGRGKQHEYLCVGCARSLYGLEVPSIMDDDQEKLF